MNDLKIDLQMERFGFGLADLPPDLKIGGFANHFANHFCDFVFANGRFVRTNSTFFVQIHQYFFINRQNDLTFANRPTNSQPKDKKKLSTANWQSDHYLAFTWVSLFHFSPLDG